MSQLRLFDDGPRQEDTDARRSRVAARVPAAGGREALATVYADAAALAARLPPSVFFGTSSWSFPGWTGLVYSAETPPSRIAREGLREYARHPLLQTVGIDRSYYAPIPIDDLRRYADQLPPGFPCCAKAPASVTSRADPGARRTDGAGVNPGFLDPQRFVEEMLEPFAVGFAGHCGPFIIEVPPTPRSLAIDPCEFVERLDRFLEHVPRTFEYAVELRERALLTPAYAAVLARHGVSHAYNYWSAMPMPGAQADEVPIGGASFAVVRLLLRPGTWYGEQREAFRPFDRMVQPDDQMRRDVVEVVRRAVARQARVYVLVNNKAEGSAPLTIRALAERVAAALDLAGSGSAGTPA